MTVQARFSDNDVDVAPGATAVLWLTVANLGAGTESFSLSPVGLGAGWTTIRPAYVTLFGGAEEYIDVEVRPPRLPSTTAGPTALGVRIVPQSDPDDITTTETTLHIAPTHDRVISALQPALRSRRRAVFELMVENQGNIQASCRLHLVDPSHRIDGDFDPPAVGVEPGGTSIVRLKVRALRRQWDRRSRSVPFKVEADQQGAPTVEAAATFVQAPMIPERLGWRLAGLLVICGVVAGAWFGLAKPYIDRQARTKVIAPAVTTPIAIPGQAPVIVASTIAPDNGETNAPPATAAPIGEYFSTPMPTSAAVGQKQTNEYTVPDGMMFDLTDIWVQNPFGDQGVLRMRAGDIPMVWDLALLEGFDGGRQFVTPVRLDPGDVVSVEVSCAEVGQQGASTCGPNVVIGGVLTPVDDSPTTSTTEA